MDSPPVAKSAPRATVHPAYGVIYAFQGVPDGEKPYTSLLDVNGTLYGTTKLGGSSNNGTVFQIDTGTSTALTKSLDGSTDGSRPEAGLIQKDGVFYATASIGGASSAGTVFKLASNAIAPVYTFPGGNNGANPVGHLLDVGGTLYGTTVTGGTHGGGTVFQTSLGGSDETVIHSFAGEPNDGLSPYDGLLNIGGVFYGTTQYGGKSDKGTVFSITPSGTEKILYNFGSASNDAQQPVAGLSNVGNTLYGTTARGGTSNAGTIFSIATDGKDYKVLYSFKAYADGKTPEGGVLAYKGTLYGTTASGGAGKRGTVYAFVLASRKETVIHSFPNFSGDGIAPERKLIIVGGMLYGTTAGGGSKNCIGGCGTVFAIKP